MAAENAHSCREREREREREDNLKNAKKVQLGQLVHEEKNNKKDKDIQIIRIIAMFSIILCHIMQETDIKLLEMISQFLNVGVYIFLFISGYLYGRKEIKDIKQFYKNRILKILLPMYIFIIALNIITLFTHSKIEIKYLFIYLFDLQYLLGTMQGASHLWFITVIMLCYIITPVLYKFRERIIENKLIIFASLCVLNILAIFINAKFAHIIIHVIIYMIGYIWDSKNEKNKLSAIIVFICCIAVRIVGKLTVDGSVFYDVFLSSYTHLGIALSLFVILKNIILKYNNIFKNNKLLDCLDKYSYYIYITHYMFMTGPVRTMGITNNMFCNIIITITLSYISAVILYTIYNFIINNINKKEIKVVNS